MSGRDHPNPDPVPNQFKVMQVVIGPQRLLSFHIDIYVVDSSQIFSTYVICSQICSSQLLDMQYLAQRLYLAPRYVVVSSQIYCTLLQDMQQLAPRYIVFSRVFCFNPKKHKQQISNTIEAYIVNLDVSFLGKKNFPSKLMGRGHASALKNYALTHKCKKIIFFKYSRVIHQKKRRTH